jgi:hypothetical protein
LGDILFKGRIRSAGLVAALFGASILLTSCGSESNSTSMQSEVILLDISSGLNKAGTFTSEDHSITSLSSRATQLRTKLVNALDERKAIYFGFVRMNYGQQQIETLVSPRLIQLIDKILAEDVKNEDLRKASIEGINKSWSSLIFATTPVADDKCRKIVQNGISIGSNGSISDVHAAQLAGILCSTAQSANDQIAGLINAPENIGSDIQSAVDRSIEKLSSDERRLFNSEGKPIILVPTIILVSDLIQITNGVKILDVLDSDAKPSDACQRAKDESKNYSVRLDGIALISDGFASTKGNIDQDKRDKLREYWKCWFESRGIYDQDLGTRGINIGDL